VQSSVYPVNADIDNSFFTFTLHGREFNYSLFGLFLTVMSAIPSPLRTGSLLQQRVQSIREYEVIRDGNVFGTSFTQSFVYSSEYDEAREQLAHLISRYQDVPFESVFHGSEVENEYGVCFDLESRHEISTCTVNIGRFLQEMQSDLMLVQGIGPAVQRKLKARGYETLPDLLNHPRYRQNAESVLSCLTDGNSAEIADLIGGRHSRSHPGILGTTCLHKPEDFVFFDIETLGLFSRPIILFGIGSLKNGRFCVHQYLLRDVEEEQAALMATVEHLSGDHPALVTFNGKSFDLPYLSDRLAYYGMGTPGPVPHFDMLHFSRKRWKGTLPSFRLTALEKEILGISRDDDIPGAMVPEFYEAYRRSGNCGPLVPILEHNRQDVVSLARIFFHLVGESYGSF
jgi:uncharacterized protein